MRGESTVHALEHKALSPVKRIGCVVATGPCSIVWIPRLETECERRTVPSAPSVIGRITFRCDASDGIDSLSGASHG